MKKIVSLVLLFAVALSLSGCVLADVSSLYSPMEEKEGFAVSVNKTANCCFVGVYTCADPHENREITVPDAYDGRPVTKLGGYYGRGVSAPFGISLEVCMNAPKGDKYANVFYGDIGEFQISDDYTVEDIVFDLYIGKNIKEIDNVEMDVYYPHINADGSITFYHPVVRVVCAEENKYFYSEDGKLYNRKTNEPIAAFAYAE
ncbi:MAG: hypothetical protein J6S59_00070 [Clostridia bacterium]|nr:hypothetical protein [Clostridia bacterium]